MMKIGRSSVFVNVLTPYTRVGHCDNARWISVPVLASLMGNKLTQGLKRIIAGCTDKRLFSYHFLGSLHQGGVHATSRYSSLGPKKTELTLQIKRLSSHSPKDSSDPRRQPRATEHIQRRNQQTPEISLAQPSIEKPCTDGEAHEAAAGRLAS